VIGTIIFTLEGNEVGFAIAPDHNEVAWNEATTWWLGAPTADTPIPRYFQINFGTFMSNLAWVDHMWVARGGEVEIASNLLEAVSATRAKGELFETLCSQSFPVEAVSAHIEGFTRNLTDFQRRDVASLLRMPFGSNFSVPGSGKTFETLAVWQSHRIAGLSSQLLVVAPKSAFSSWVREVADVFETPPIVQLFTSQPIDPESEIVVVNYEQIQVPAKRNRLIGWVSRAQTNLVIDEAHRIKAGASAIRWRACFDLRQHVSRVDVLTGTPMPQDYEDLRSLFQLSWNALPNRLINDSGIRSMLRGGVFVRTTKDELELPLASYRTQVVDMGPVQSQIYAALKREYAGSFLLSSSSEDYFSRKGKAALTLIAASTNAGLLYKDISEDSFMNLRWPPRSISNDASLLTAVETYSSVEIPPKYIWLIKHVAECVKQGRKLLIWSSFVGNLLAIEKLLQNYNPVVVYGAVSEADRLTRIEQFELDPSCHVLITNPQTLGEGISLHHICHDAVFVDRSFNAGLYLQALDRIHRLGLKPGQETRITHLVTKGSVDEQVARRLEIKIQNLFDVLGDPGLVKADPEIDEFSAELDIEGFNDEDLDSLMSHLRQS
jgi:SNF2 family DNA or RNA helicase